VVAIRGRFVEAVRHRTFARFSLDPEKIFAGDMSVG